MTSWRPSCAPAAARRSAITIASCSRGCASASTAISRSNARVRRCCWSPALARTFPEARFVHLYRDGRDAAISMQRHNFFRLTASFAAFLTRCGLDPFRPPFIYGASRLYAPIETVAFRLFPVETWLDRPVTVEAMGAYWSRLVESGVAFLAALPRERVLNLCYEDILVRPRAELARFMTFLGREFEDAAWLERASAIPHPTGSRWQQLPREQRDALTAACRPGLSLLGYA